MSALALLEREHRTGRYRGTPAPPVTGTSPAALLPSAVMLDRFALLPNYVTLHLEARDGDLLWTGATSMGYGRVLHEGRSWQVHRLVWSVVVGPLPSRRVHLHHLCSESACVLPTHLMPATPYGHHKVPVSLRQG